MSDEEDEELYLEPNVLSAIGAACVAYAQIDGRAGALPEHDASWLGFDDNSENETVKRAVETAAAFVRNWPNESPEAAGIHLRRSGFKDVPAIGHRERAAWKVFATTLHALDAADKAAAIEAEEKRRAEEQRGPTARSSDDLTYQPQKVNELSDLGRATAILGSPTHAGGNAAKAQE